MMSDGRSDSSETSASVIVLCCAGLLCRLAVGMSSYTSTAQIEIQLCCVVLPGSIWCV